MTPLPFAESAGARRAIDGAASWIEALARVGYASRGVIYITIGALAIAVARGSGGRTTDSRGALEQIGDQPLGKAALVIITLGLAGYAIWRLTEALSNPARLGHNAKDVFRRVGHGVRGVIYGALAFAAARLAMGGSSGASAGNTQDLTARVMEMPAGRFAIGLVGAIIFGYGIHSLIKAWRSDIGKHMRVAEMSRDTTRQIVHVSRFGIAARGIVFVLMGWFFAQAAMQYDPSEAGGVGEALDALARQPHGQWLLGTVALGLVAFGIHSLLEAKYRRIDVA